MESIRVYDAAGHELVTLAAAAEHLGMTVQAARVARHRGRFPDPAGQLDGRTPLWRINDLDAASDPVPYELRCVDRWVRRSAKKVPVTLAGRPASSTDPATWSNWSDAAASDAGVGLGFVLAADGIVCIDIDNCIHDGRPDDRAQELLEAAGSTWVEISPSGRGLHIWGRSTTPVNGRNVPGVAEVYGHQRYIAVTGDTFDNAKPELGDITELVEQLLAM